MPSRQLQVSSKSHQGGKAGGKDQYSGCKPISSLYELLIVPWEPGVQTHAPEAFAFLTEHSFLPFPQDPDQCEMVYEGTGVHHISSSLNSACCMASALSKPYTLMLLSPDAALASQWDDQEFCSPVKLHPVLLTGAVNPCLPVESLGIYARNLQKASRHSDRKVGVNETPFCKRGKNSSAAITKKDSPNTHGHGIWGHRTFSHTSLGVQCLYFNVKKKFFITKGIPYLHPA